MASLDPDEKIPWLATVLSAPLRSPHSLVAGVGEDDCAIIDLAPRSILIVTSDYVNSNPIMLSLGIGTYYELGRYLLNSNIADLCGSGAEPVAALISIMWDRGRPESDFEAFMRGVQDAASYAGIAIVGGDTKLSSRPAYCATAIGTATSRSHLFIKNRARPGDGVWVSGSLGSCAAAVYGWDEMSADSSWLEWGRRVVGDPPLPLDLARQASELAMEASGTDLSDGLGSDLASLCDASKVGVEIVADALPVDPHVTPLAARLGVPPYGFAFTVGGDLQFLLSADEQYSSALEGLGFARIGTIHPNLAHRKLIYANGWVTDLPSAGHRDARAMSFHEEINYLLNMQIFEA